MVLLSLAYRSLLNRKLTTIVTLLSIGLSVSLWIGIEHIRTGARESFSNTISQTDLIVGARGGPIQLLLYTVFHIGTPTANVTYDSYEKIRNHKVVLWTIPISLGDSHRGYRVVGTNEDFYRHYRYRQDQQLEFSIFWGCHIVGEGCRSVAAWIAQGLSKRFLPRYRLICPGLKKISGHPSAGSRPRHLPQREIVRGTSDGIRPNHVGLYIGDNRFIHAERKAGRVIITDLNRPWYVKHFLGARRVVESVEE